MKELFFFVKTFYSPVTITDRMGQPAKAVVPAGGDDRVLPVLIGYFFKDQVSEYVITRNDLAYRAFEKFLYLFDSTLKQQKKFLLLVLLICVTISFDSHLKMSVLSRLLLANNNILQPRVPV